VNVVCAPENKKCKVDVPFRLFLGADMSFDPFPLGDQSLMRTFFHLLKLAALGSIVGVLILTNPGLKLN